MSPDKDGRPMTKEEFMAKKKDEYHTKYNFLPAKQIKGKMEEAWKRLYGPKKAKPRPTKPVISKTKVEFIDEVPTEKKKVSPEKKKVPDPPDKRKLISNDEDTGDDQNASVQIKEKKDKLETTIELLSDDNKSVGFIEYKKSGTFLKLPNGQSVPWTHSTPVRLTRNNTHLKEISRLPFSPI